MNFYYCEECTGITTNLNFAIIHETNYKHNIIQLKDLNDVNIKHAAS